MHVVILHNAVTDHERPDAQDVLVQVEVVQAALQRLGHSCSAMPCTLDFGPLVTELRATTRPVVFNLVESLGGSDALMHLAPALLDALSVPYTGTPTAALALTTDKVATKQRLRAGGLPTPDWIDAETRSGELMDVRPGAFIIKCVREEASLGLDDEAVVTAVDGADLARQVISRQRIVGQACFAEQFIDGREINLALLEQADGPQVLPPAEIVFDAFPRDKPRLVGYQAKWDCESFEYQHTPRRFDFPERDQPLLRELSALALRCWTLLGLRGYARVDFRVDEAGRPWILEANANPCLSPDAGFAAALQRANIAFEVAVDRILGSAMAAGSREHSTDKDPSKPLTRG